jgi:hypothetical protein
MGIRRERQYLACRRRHEGPLDVHCPLQGGGRATDRRDDHSTTRVSGPPGPLTTVSDGTYLVGTDMAAGSYKSPGSSDGCYWARLKDDGGQNIIANDFTTGQTRFTAKKGEFVKVSGCTFTKI